MLRLFKTYLSEEKSNAPIIVFRILFGLMMCFSTIRFMMMGWVNDFYIMPKTFFPFEGFYWLEPLSENGMYFIFGLMIVSSLGIMLGLYYRISASIFFLCFTYVELLDKSNYLNHYYFVSLMALLMIFLPANKRFSLDVYFNKTTGTNKTSNLMLWAPKAQLAIVYIFAGIAKLNADWLLHALPLKIWLPAQMHLPLIGELLKYEWVAYLFSWFGAIYDLFIVFFLLNNKTRKYAYFFVIVFHVLTRILFPIGMFPYIMIVSTLLFFSTDFHEKILKGLSSAVGLKDFSTSSVSSKTTFNSFFYYFLLLFFFFQLLFPFRYLCYPGNLFWTEQGYRFSWRVMLMEKAGYATFYVEDSNTKKRLEVNNKEFLTTNQEKMMSTQSDMIVQYAHFLYQHYAQQGVSNPKIYADVYVNLNGRGSRRYINPDIDLSKEHNTWRAKKWILSDEK